MFYSFQEDFYITFIIFLYSHENKQQVPKSLHASKIREAE